MAQGALTYRGVEMTKQAAEVAEWAGIDPSEDVRRVRDSKVSRTQLAHECEEGIDDPYIVDAWREYVSAVCLAAGLTLAPECGHSGCRQNWVETGESECVQEE